MHALVSAITFLWFAVDSEHTIMWISVEWASFLLTVLNLLVFNSLAYLLQVSLFDFGFALDMFLGFRTKLLFKIMAKIYLAQFSALYAKYEASNSLPVDENVKIEYTTYPGDPWLDHKANLGFEIHLSLLPFYIIFVILINRIIFTAPRKPSLIKSE